VGQRARLLEAGLGVDYHRRAVGRVELGVGMFLRVEVNPWIASQGARPKARAGGAGTARVEHHERRWRIAVVDQDVVAGVLDTRNAVVAVLGAFAQGWSRVRYL